jgi:phosphoenolpyruvate carboxykinase (GTP)
MRPFFGYNFGHYLQHWFDVNKDNRKMPKVFHVNWFRKSADGKFLWPGFGENVRVLEWIMRRSGENAITGNAKETAIGLVPEFINTEGLKEEPDMEALFAQSKDYHQGEIEAFKTYLDEQVGDDVPAEIHNQIANFQARVDKM